MEEHVKCMMMRAKIMTEKRPCYDVLILHLSDVSLGGTIRYGVRAANPPWAGPSPVSHLTCSQVLTRGCPLGESPEEPEHDLEPEVSLESAAGLEPREGASDSPETRGLVSTAGLTDPSCMARRLLSFSPT